MIWRNVAKHALSISDVTFVNQYVSSPTDHVEVQVGDGGATVALQTEHNCPAVFSHAPSEQAK